MQHGKKGEEKERDRSGKKGKSIMKLKILNYSRVNLILQG